MSLAQLKAKEVKEKQNLLPKLRTILANPIKTKCPTLEENEFKGFCSLLHDVIRQSEMDAQEFKKAKQIQLGLESCLRAINNCQTSCVFISLSIKPKHIISLIVRNALVKDETQPIYAQPGLEDFTQQLFGIRSLILVLPRHLRTISQELFEWVEKRKNSRKLPKIVENGVKECKKLPQVVKNEGKNRRTSPQDVKNEGNPKPKKLKITKADEEETFEKVEQMETSEPSSPQWSSDFISLDKSGSHDVTKKMKLETEEKDELESALLSMINIKDTQKDSSNLGESVKLNEIGIDKKHAEDSDDMDEDFLTYQPAIVHYIQPNPNKKKERKRKRDYAAKDCSIFEEHAAKRIRLTSLTKSIHFTSFVNKYKKTSTRDDIDTDSDEETETDFKDERDSKIVKAKVNSLRADLVLKAGLNVARKQLNENDEVDVIRGFSQSNPSHLIVSRIVILSTTEVDEGFRVNLRRYKSLLIENYSRENAYKSSETSTNQ
uniref:Uncharacterized protein n=1 Tax=Glossina pallidipes TaxID=7398 RepID=A0A1B0A455_GLOPL